jgi:hypothetical protein
MQFQKKVSRSARGNIRAAPPAVKGREYFGRLASEQKIETLNAAEISELPPLAKLKKGRSESRLGGRIARDLILLTPEETVQQHEKADKLEHRPRRSFPAEQKGSR